MKKNWPQKRIILMSIGTLLGAGIGYIYWYYVGCNSGTCLITSKAPNSTIYGLIMGGLMAGTVWDYVNKKENK